MVLHKCWVTEGKYGHFFLTCLCLTLSTHPSSEPARHSNGIETVPSKLVHTLLDEFASALLVFISSNAAFNLCSSSLRYPVQNHMRKMSPKALWNFTEGNILHLAAGRHLYTHFPSGGARELKMKVAGGILFQLSFSPLKRELESWMEVLLGFLFWDLGVSFN